MIPRTSVRSTALRRFLVLLFLMLPPPPRSTLFPTRRSSDLAAGQLSIVASDHSPWPLGQKTQPEILQNQSRSEEHTSELQSLTNLVCRLLLEKKNKRTEQFAYSKTRAKHARHAIPTLPQRAV